MDLSYRLVDFTDIGAEAQVVVIGFGGYLRRAVAGGVFEVDKIAAHLYSEHFFKLFLQGSGYHDWLFAPADGCPAFAAPKMAHANLAPHYLAGRRDFESIADAFTDFEFWHFFLVQKRQPTFYLQSGLVGIVSHFRLEIRQRN